MALEISVSERLRLALRHFSLVQNRPIAEASPIVHVRGGRCASCGFEVNLDYSTPADTLRAVSVMHELSWESGRRCGGQILFTTG